MVRQVGGEIGKLNAAVSLFVDDSAVDLGADLVQVALARGDRLLGALAAAHAREPFDLVHCHEWYSVPVALRARELGVPVVLSPPLTEPERAHGRPAHRPLPGDLRLGAAGGSPRRASSSCPRAATRQQVIALYAAEPGRVLTVPDLGDGGALPALDPARAKGALGIDASAPVVLFAGRSRMRQAPTCWRRPSRPCVAITRPCASSSPGGPLRGEIAAQLAAAGVGERCHFLGDVPAERFESVLVASDFVVIPARTWQDGGLAERCIARGKPVLTTRQANLGCVRHGENGLVTYDNPGSIVWGVRELLAGPLGDSERWRWALTRAGRRPTLDRVTVEHLLAYETVAGPGGRATLG
jgi:D-inositol-3-phosphate glycosyltransferase